MESRLIFLRLLYTKSDGEPWSLRTDGYVRLRGPFGGTEVIKALPRKASIAAGTANRHR
jgi:hypothetical protein